MPSAFQKRLACRTHVSTAQHAMVTLRQWQDSDLEPFIAMNADPDVMRYFLARDTRAESVERFNRMRGAIEKLGWGVWAVEVGGQFAGMVGLMVPRWPLPFMPCTEILWRL